MTSVSLLLIVTALVVSSVVESCPPSEWAALMAFKASLNEPSVGIFHSWRGTNCCYRWYGVHCDPTTRRVVDITLRGLLDDPAFKNLNRTGYMSGSISPSICHLPQLSTLSISDWKAISGPIPRCLPSSLPFLQILDLSGNVLSGSIPHDIGRLRQLTMLNLADNHLSGRIPSTLVNLSRLTHLDLRNNALGGPIPRDIDRLRMLNRALLSHNRITGPIPWTISRIYRLADLDLSLNRISGRIPKALGTMPVLDSLKLKYNKLRGGVPASLLSSRMSHIDLSRNNLVGRVADVFHQGTYFINLDLSYNKLRGGVPKSMKLANPLKTC
ncbi:hypothetical protein K1719_036200 [Acacia pycnantha]|nr:hypothetical protein K1719_036200 [Acacia pycnantha]